MDVVLKADFCLTLSKIFDRLTLTGDKIFAFNICLENLTNFEESNISFDLLVNLKMLIFRVIVGVTFYLFWGAFLGHFGGSFWGVRCCIAKVLSRNLKVLPKTVVLKPLSRDTPSSTMH